MLTTRRKKNDNPAVPVRRGTRDRKPTQSAREGTKRKHSPTSAASEPQNKKRKTTGTDESTENADSFQLLGINDVTQHTAEHVNHIFLMDSSKVPEGGPTGIANDMLTSRNYPNMDPSELNEECAPFLIRKESVTYLQDFQRMKRSFEKNGYIIEAGNYFAGPGGNGKSYLLYHIVQFCRASGWLVFYIPRLGETAIKNEENTAEIILNRFLKAEQTKLTDIKDADGVSLAECITTGIEKKEYFQTLDYIIRIFSKNILRYPVFIAVDEWNSKFTYPENKIFQLFASEKYEAGYWLYAVSSSFDPTGSKGFHNADLIDLQQNILPYTQNEFESILRCQQYYKRLPEDIDENKINIIQKLSGIIPRMVYTWCSVWRKDLNNSFDAVRADFCTAATIYYMERIKMIMVRAEKMDDKIMVHKDAAFVILNQKIPFLAQLWEYSGLFTKCGDFWECVCSPAKLAFVKYLLLKATPTIEALLDDPTTNWRAFELLVALRFRRVFTTTVKLRNKDLCGDLRQPNELNIDVSNVIDVADPIESLESLEPGTLLILPAGHPVCDMVAYSKENCELFFIQISKSRYSKHTSKVTDLSNSYKSEDKPIIKFFMDLCRRDGKKRFNKRVATSGLSNKLPNGVYFVYITTSNSVVRTSSSFCNHPVVLVDGDELDRFGDEWKIYRDRLTAYKYRDEDLAD